MLQERQLELDIHASGKILLRESHHPTLDDGIDENPAMLDFWAVSMPSVATAATAKNDPLLSAPLKGCIRLPRSTNNKSFHYQESLLPEPGTEVRFCMDLRPDIKLKGIMMEVQYSGKQAGQRMAIFELVDVTRI